MNQKLLIVVGALLLTLNLHAALIEYKFTGSETDTGAGANNRYALAGMAIYDTATSNMTFITWMPNKTYTDYVVTNYQPVTVVGPGGQKDLVLSVATSETDTNGHYHSTSEMLAGADVDLHIGHNHNVLFPQKFTSSNSSLAPDEQGNEWLSSWTEILLYDYTQTVKDNNAGLDLEQVVNAIVVGLKEKGYTNAN